MFLLFLSLYSFSADETSTPSFRKTLPAKLENGCKSTLWNKSQNMKSRKVKKQLPLSRKERVRILKKAPFESEKPVFRVVIQPSYKWNVVSFFITI